MKTAKLYKELREALQSWPEDELWEVVQEALWRKDAIINLILDEGYLDGDAEDIIKRWKEEQGPKEEEDNLPPRRRLTPGEEQDLYHAVLREGQVP